MSTITLLFSFFNLSIFSLTVHPTSKSNHPLTLKKVEIRNMRPFIVQKWLIQSLLL